MRYDRVRDSVMLSFFYSLYARQISINKEIRILINILYLIIINKTARKFLQNFVKL